MTSDRTKNRDTTPHPAPDDEPRCGACGHARRMHMNDRGVRIECRPASNFRPHAGWCNRYRKPRQETDAEPAVVRKWTGREAEALRCAARMSVQGFAEYLGVSARAVSRWAKLGARTVPRPYMQAILDTALARVDEDTLRRFDVLRCDRAAQQ